MIFLDNDLCIKRFTSHAKRVINLIPSDIGRHFNDITTNLKYDRLAQDAKGVLRDLVFRERETEGNEGTCYLVRILPYRTIENVIEGVVITFQDISEHKRGKIARRLAVIVQDSMMQSQFRILMEISKHGTKVHKRCTGIVKRKPFQ
ncbi:MAG: PAS domain-containing protein [Thermodesulfobacteriota bacterium]|nr:PAS domain-containing protein [Thermodesulfobacteriota bacterium]